MLGAISLLIRSPGLAHEKPTKKLSTSETLHAVLYKPTPEYPYSARRQHETGGGVFVLHIDDKTGLVTDVTIARTTGHADLDDAAMAAFERWRVKPGTITKITVPVTFTFGGASFGEVVVSGGTPAMDRALVSYLGEGTVLNGSGPIYPTAPPWTYKTGHGVYELHVAKTGYVSTVNFEEQR